MLAERVFQEWLDIIRMLDGGWPCGRIRTHAERALERTWVAPQRVRWGTKHGSAITQQVQRCGTAQRMTSPSPSKWEQWTRTVGAWGGASIDLHLQSGRTHTRRGSLLPCPELARRRLQSHRDCCLCGVQQSSSRHGGAYVDSPGNIIERRTEITRDLPSWLG